MQPIIEGWRVHARLQNCFAALAAFAIIALPSFAFAAPPVATEKVAFFTREWWIETVGGLVSEDVLRMLGQLAIALAILAGGWLVAKLFSAGIYRVLRKTDLDNKLAAKLGLTMLLEDRKKKPGDEDALERGVSLVVYYMLMALVVVAVLDHLGLDQTASPIQDLVGSVIRKLPVIAVAIVILVIAYFAGLILSTLVTRALKLAKFDRGIAKLEVGDPAATDASTKEDGSEGAKPKSFSEMVGEIVFWLVMLLGIAAAFDTLDIQAISAPLTNVINELMGLLPVVGIAAVIGIGGYLLAKVVRAIVTTTLESMGFDKLVAKVKLDKLFGGSSASKVVGWLAMAMIIVQTVIAALNQVGLVTLSAPMTDMMAQFWDLLPSLGISALFVIVGVFVGRLLREIVQKTLVGVGFDRLMTRIGFGQIAERDDELGKPSGLVAFVVQVVIVLLAVVQGLENLELGTWAGYVDAFLRFAVTRAAVAMLIVGVGFVVGNYVRDLIEARQRGEVPAVAEGEVLPGPEPVWMAEFARYAVLVFAFTMAVHQLGVAEDFVLLTFALLFGALCLAGALAFGLGSRELAGEIVRERYRKAKQSNGPTVPSASLFGGSGSVKPPTKPGI